MQKRMFNAGGKLAARARKAHTKKTGLPYVPSDEEVCFRRGYWALKTRQGARYNKLLSEQILKNLSPDTDHRA